MSQVATYRDLRAVVAKPYAPGGCPIQIGKQKCGETVGLDIIMDFHKLYQEKMSEIDVSAGGDSLQEKVYLQEKWIEDLTAQNKLLAKVIEELESETIGRVQQLEDKLNNAVKSFGEVIFYLAHDMKSLLEFIRRIRDECRWSIHGLYFYEVSWKDLFGSESDKMTSNKRSSEKTKSKEQILERRKIEELEDNLKALPAAEEDLKKRSEESDRLKQEMEEMRAALTEEIAKKHDAISLLRRDIYHLEEKNCETLKETSIKDDIIKELRKELKRSKQKIVNSRKEAEKPRAETAEKSVNTMDTEILRITHSEVPQENTNSTVIFIHRGDEDDAKETKSRFDSSDSSECGLSESVFDRQVHTCRSENDMKLINWMRPTKERSILTKIRKNIRGEQGTQEEERSPRRLNIPRHIPVKTYVNNIEYSKE